VGKATKRAETRTAPNFRPERSRVICVFSNPELYRALGRRITFDCGKRYKPKVIKSRKRAHPSTPYRTRKRLHHARLLACRSRDNLRVTRVFVSKDPFPATFEFAEHLSNIFHYHRLNRRPRPPLVSITAQSLIAVGRAPPSILQHYHQLTYITSAAYRRLHQLIITPALHRPPLSFICKYDLQTSESLSIC
jgi:hypothetical protein